MDLIYADEKKKDIGVLTDYTLDLAYGKDENDFECVVYKDNHVCREGYMLYIEGTEYGGFIDKIKVDTLDGTVSYCGRTWHGILEGKVLEPEPGEDYLLLSGEANEVLGSVIKKCGLTDIFTVDNKDSGIEIVEYPVRYGNAYTVIRKLLYEFGGKLDIRYRKNMAELSVVPYMDYSQDEEFDSSQTDFQIEKNYRPLNHLVCLGNGDLRERHVIHLFTDENGGVQPYAISDSPLRDSDYILNKSGQKLFGKDEVAGIYDYANAADTVNYILIHDKPHQWEQVYGNYYEIDENGDYSVLESTIDDVYTLQKVQPLDWNFNYTDYYQKENDSYSLVEEYSEIHYTLQTEKPSDWKRGCEEYFKKSGSSYTKVQFEEAVSYSLQGKKPSDWNKKYKEYFYLWSDGLTSEYRAVEGITKYRYEVQTLIPSDWEENYQSYYLKNKNKAGYSKVPESNALRKAPVWKPKCYYTRVSYQIAPTWEKQKYYTQKKYKQAPVWKAGTYYTKSVQNVPAWKTGTYYTKSVKTFLPGWIPDAYYEKTTDHYAELVAGGLEKIAQSYNCDKISIKFSSENIYDIGDTVGALENITGIAVWQPITKKIVTIRENKEEIQYEIGE